MILIYGGTFDPIHLGHTRLVEHVFSHLEFDEFRFMPCFKPVHKVDAGISADHRIEMLNLAIKELPEKYRKKIVTDDREVRSGKPKFSVDSLAEIRHEIGEETPIAFVMGADSLLGLETWHQWSELARYCHLVVVSRPGFDVSLVPAPILEAFQWLDQASAKQLLTKPGGNCYFLPGLEQNISSTMIRADIQENKNSVPQVVFDYILRNHLYNA